MIETIIGKTIAGKGLGRKLGYPTLNLSYDGGLSGIYVGRVFVNGEWEKAAVHLGGKPTFEDDEVTCESYLVDFDSEVDLGTDIKVELLKKIRDTKKFDNPEVLKKWISEDVEFVKDWYNSKGKK